MKTPLPLRRTALVAALAAALPAVALAAPASTSAYRTDAQNTHVEDATSKGVNQVNMITCFMTSMRPDALVNQGNYLALVDKNKCDPDSRSSSSNSGSDSAGSTSAPSYMTATVNSTRASNSDPMMVKTWIDEAEKDFNATIYVHTTASEAPSGANPYGVFRLDYCGKGSTGPCMMRGYLQGSASGIDYFEIEGGGGGGGGGSRALTLTTSGTDSGAGMLQMSEMGQNVAYSFAYNANYFRRSDGTNDQCFSRDASDPETGMSVWSYGLYTADTGERVTRNSGFPVDYTASDGKLYHGHMGYWGLWLPPEANVSSGATVQRVQYTAGQEPTRTDYTLVKAEGRLMKYTKKTRTLAGIDKLKFQTFVWNVTGFFSGAEPNKQYEMYWDDSAGVFKVTGTIECSNGPCESKDLATEQPVSPSFFSSQGDGNVHGWSQALGGEIFIPLHGVSTVDSSTLHVVYRVQDLVYPADMPATLYCLHECPTAASMADYFGSGSTAPSPFVAATFGAFGPTDPANVVSYSMDSSTALLKDAGGNAVTMTDSAALQSHPQYQWGVRTGRLVTDLSAALCNDGTHYCDGKVNELDIYYQWETGPNQWNQFAAVKDSSGSIVTFDAPLQVSYTVPSGAAYGAYAGKSIVLQYGGFGELWGIPGHCVSHITNEPVSCDTQDSRYVPAFVIPFDETLGAVMNGATPMLAKWLDREIRFARKDPSVCSGAGVTLPSGLTLPTATGLADPSDPASSIYIGDKPTVTAAPRVIQGEVKY